MTLALHVLAWLAAAWMLVGAALLITEHSRPCGIAWLLWPPSLLLPPLLVPFALLVAMLTTPSHPPGMWPAYLPRAFAWLQTPDQALPGDLTIPAVGAIYVEHGWFICSWYWLGIRNSAQGLAAKFGRPVAMPWSPEPGYYEGVDLTGAPIWWMRKPIFSGRLQVKAGYRTYPDGKGGWTAVPCLTVTKP